MRKSTHKIWIYYSKKDLGFPSGPSQEMSIKEFIYISNSKPEELLLLTVRLTDGRELGNVHSLTENEFTLKTTYHVYRLTRLTVNRCCRKLNSPLFSPGYESIDLSVP